MFCNVIDVNIMSSWISERIDFWSRADSYMQMSASERKNAITLHRDETDPRNLLLLHEKFKYILRFLLLSCIDIVIA